MVIDFVVKRIDASVIIAARWSDRLIVVDYFKHETLALRQLDDDAGRFDFTPDGSCLLMGHWDTAAIDVWNWRSDECRRVAGPRSAIRFLSDPSAGFIVAEGTDRHELIDTQSGERTRLRFTHYVSHGFYFEPRKQFWIPSRKKGQVLRISLEPVALDFARVEERTIDFLALTPDKLRFLTSSAPNRVCMRRIDDLSLCWEWKAPKSAGTCDGIYLPSARIATVSVPAQCTFILDAATGEEIERLDYLIDPPFEGTRCFESDGRELEIYSGERSTGMSQSTWWRELGL